MSLTLNSADFSALVDACQPADDSALALGLTVIFHPDFSLLGARAEWSMTELHSEQLIGRGQPGLMQAYAPQQPARVLADPYISRVALGLRACDGGFQLLRHSAGNRIEVDGVPLRDGCVLDEARLRAGVRVCIAHRVLLLLRLAVSAGGVSAPLPGLLGSSPGMSLLRDQIRRVAPTHTDVLLLGATGTGKEQVARAIHALSARAQAPLFAINLAVVPPELAAVELFGARRGAYTGAHRDVSGYFIRADGATLFLDEVGDAPASVQPQLLRALQQREVQVLGGETRTVDLRVLSATDVAVDAAHSGFRGSLRHRLGAMELQLPTLAQRPEDMGVLFLHYFSQGLEVAGRAQLLQSVPHSPDLILRCIRLLERFLTHEWPGNVRELVNVCLQFAVHCDEHLIGWQALLPRLEMLEHEVRDVSPAVVEQSNARRCAGWPRRSRLQALGDEEFLTMLRAEAYSAARLGRALGVSRQAVYRRMEATPGCHTAASVSSAAVATALCCAGGDVLRAAQALGVSGLGLRARLGRERRSACGATRSAVRPDGPGSLSGGGPESASSA